MSLSLFESLLIVLCVNTNDAELATSKCVDYMVNCVHVHSLTVSKKDFSRCEQSYKDGKRYQEEE